MNILFAVQGEGRGHMTQAIAVNQMLRRHGLSAYLFHGVMEENVIFHIMLDATRISPSEIKRPEVFRRKEITAFKK